jgi:hypothetical protein
MLLGGVWGRYVPPSRYGWQDFPTVDVPLLDYDTVADMSGAWICMPALSPVISERALRKLRHDVLVLLVACGLPYVIEYFTLYPFRHAVFETNFRVGKAVVDRLDLLDLLVDARFSPVVYRSVWAEGLTDEHDDHGRSGRGAGCLRPTGGRGR